MLLDCAALSFRSDWDAMYFAGRWAIPINSNPFYVIKRAPGDSSTQIPRAANFITRALKWVRKLNGGELEADKGCMSQYHLQFGTGRVAKEGRRTLNTDYDANHIVVVHKDQYFKVQVFDNAGSVQLSEAALEEALAAVASQAAGGSSPAVGALTTMERDAWAKERAELESNSTNAATLHDIDTSLLVLVLEEGQPADAHGLSTSLLHDDGTGSSRWYDKHNIIAMPDGTLGINFEHSFSDGMTWNRWLHEIWSDQCGKDSGFAPLPDRQPM